jgi:hypothetical protein
MRHIEPATEMDRFPTRLNGMPCVRFNAGRASKLANGERVRIMPHRQPPKMISESLSQKNTFLAFRSMRIAYLTFGENFSLFRGCMMMHTLVGRYSFGYWRASKKANCGTSHALTRRTQADAGAAELQFAISYQSFYRAGSYYHALRLRMTPSPQTIRRTECTLRWSQNLLLLNHHQDNNHLLIIEHIFTVSITPSTSPQNDCQQEHRHAI